MRLCRCVSFHVLLGVFFVLYGAIPTLVHAQPAAHERYGHDDGQQLYPLSVVHQHNTHRPQDEQHLVDAGGQWLSRSLVIVIGIIATGITTLIGVMLHPRPTPSHDDDDFPPH